MFRELKLSVARRTRERYDITDIRHARHEQQQTLKAQTEPGVGTRTELTGIEIPPHILHRDVKFVNARHQLVVIRFTLGTANDFSNLREEHIHGTHGLAVFVSYRTP